MKAPSLGRVKSLCAPAPKNRTNQEADASSIYERHFVPNSRKGCPDIVYLAHIQVEESEYH